MVGGIAESLGTLDAGSVASTLVTDGTDLSIESKP